MVEAAPRRLRKWTLIWACVGGAAAALMAACVWVIVPRWFPVWTMDHCPWVEPVIRGATWAIEQEPEYAPLPGAAEARLRKWGADAVPGIETAYASRRIAQRRVCLEALTRIGHARGVPLALRAMRDPDGEVRRLAVGLLGTFNDDPRTVPALLEAFGDPDEAVRTAALRSLACLQDPAIDALLERHDPRLPMLALYLYMDDAAFGDEFRFERTRAPIAERLVRADDPRMLELLHVGLACSDAERRCVCAMLLRDAVASRAREVIAALLPAIADANPSVATAAADSVAAVAKPGMEDLFARALSAGKQPMRLAAVATLGKLGTSAALDALESALAADDARVRIAALDELSRLDAPDKRRLVIAALSDRDATVRTNASLHLDQDDVPALLELLPETTGDTRRLIIDGLARNGDGSLEPTMVGLLGDPEPHIRWLAAGALARYGSPASRAPLEHLLDDPASDADLRVAVLAALARCGTAARPALRRALDDADGEVAGQARLSLKAIAEAEDRRINAPVP